MKPVYQIKELSSSPVKKLAKVNKVNEGAKKKPLIGSSHMFSP